MPKQRGASLVEAAIALVVLLIFLIGIFDFGRLLVIKGSLTYGANRGINLAMKEYGVSLDPRDCDEITGPCNEDTEHERLEDFTAAKDIVIQEARRFPLQTFVSSDVSGASRLLNTVLIRPGEDGHPLVPDCYDESRELLYNGYQELMKRCPLMVQLQAEVDTFLPFLPSIQLEGTAYGYREDALFGSRPAYVEDEDTGGGDDDDDDDDDTGSSGDDDDDDDEGSEECTDSPPEYCLEMFGCTWDPIACDCLNCESGEGGE